MEASVLTSTKKILGIAEDYTAFDLDVITGINAAFATLNQLGIGPTTGFLIQDKTAVWDGLNLPVVMLGMVKNYIYLKTRMMFDPPGTSFLIEAMNKQIAEFEWRLMEQATLVNYDPDEPVAPEPGPSQEYEIAVASSVWTVAHNLGIYPAVTTLDSTRRVVYGNVEYLDVDTVRITFSAAMAGYVLIN